MFYAQSTSAVILRSDSLSWHCFVLHKYFNFYYYDISGEREGERESKFVFYAQSTSAVILRSDSLSWHCFVLHKYFNFYYYDISGEREGERERVNLCFTPSQPVRLY